MGRLKKDAKIKAEVKKEIKKNQEVGNISATYDRGAYEIIIIHPDDEKLLNEMRGAGKIIGYVATEELTKAKEIVVVLKK